jgi:DNA-binding IscR family transcriptional regulator
MAVHVLAVLAHREGDRVNSASLAGSINTNPVMVRRLLLALQKATLVETCKGAGSGSRLSRSPGRIDLAEVYRAVEAGASPVRPARWAAASGKLWRRCLPRPKTPWNVTWQKPRWPM